MSLTQLRSYQRAIADKALGAGNHVVVLPTGAGKTHISFDIIFFALAAHPQKVVCFLAPTVALVQQQQHEFEKEVCRRGLHISVGLLAGGKRQHVGRCHIVFATPQAAFNEFGDHEQMKDFSLIVLDEVHHVQAKSGKSHHPYSLIVEVYGDAPNKRARPKLLGLTASPSESSEQTKRLLRRLEASLVIVKEQELVKALEEFAPRAELVTDSISCSNAFRVFSNECIATQRSLQQEISKLPEDDIAIEELKARLRCVGELAARVHCVGWGRRDLFDGLRPPPVDHALQSGWENLFVSSATDCSPCFIRLLSILEQKRPKRCIVFVETRQAARDMTKALRNVATSSEWGLEWLSPTHLVGRCKRGDDESMSMADQERILAEFRRGETNVMVATSVAEEGIDIAACNLVVRMEPVHTVIKFVQARGRARFPNSTYLIMCTHASEVSLLDTVAQRERQLEAELAGICESCVAENCWTSYASNLPDPRPMSRFPPRSAEADGDPPRLARNVFQNPKRQKRKREEGAVQDMEMDIGDLIEDLSVGSVDLGTIVDSDDDDGVNASSLKKEVPKGPEPPAKISKPTPQEVASLGNEQVVFGEILVPLTQLVPTQLTVEKRFSDGRSLLRVMAQLVRNPGDIRDLPLMKVSQASQAMLGRLSETHQESCSGCELWFSADNCRCFMFKVIAPLIPGMVSVKALQVNWTHEFDCMLNQCPRLDDTWTTDDMGVEAARDSLLRVLIDLPPDAMLRPHKRLREGVRLELFRDGEDYVSRLNLHLQRLRRPQHGELTEYRAVGINFTMEVRVSGTTEWHRGKQHKQKKTAKQSAAFEALRFMDVI